jgi:hypothetical protein
MIIDIEVVQVIDQSVKGLLHHLRLVEALDHMF